LQAGLTGQYILARDRNQDYFSPAAEDSPLLTKVSRVEAMPSASGSSREKTYLWA